METKARVKARVKMATARRVKEDLEKAKVKAKIADRCCIRVLDDALDLVLIGALHHAREYFVELRRADNAGLPRDLRDNDGPTSIALGVEAERFQSEVELVLEVTAKLTDEDEVVDEVAAKAARRRQQLELLRLEVPLVQPTRKKGRDGIDA
mmetsp:Transcript_49746/g.77685  ORF Transcript_49746/g.77685 Transcript_49746/m.77685 type:complete len:152 (+) Transcript_49746:1161-1616(+)